MSIPQVGIRMVNEELRNPVTASFEKNVKKKMKIGQESAEMQKMPSLGQTSELSNSAYHETLFQNTLKLLLFFLVSGGLISLDLQK